jgi:hypothetical protein
MRTTKTFTDSLAKLTTFITSNRELSSLQVAAQLQLLNIVAEPSHILQVHQDLVSYLLAVEEAHFKDQQKPSKDRLKNPDHPVKRAFLVRFYNKYIREHRTRYEAVIKTAFQQFPDDKEKRSELIKQGWKGKSPPAEKAVFPYTNSKTVFVRLDKKVLQYLFPDKKDRLAGVWWWRAIMTPYSKKANIPQLRALSNVYAKSERGMFSAISNPDVEQCPWVIGPSFQTDGRQLRLQLLSSFVSKPVIPGTKDLQKSGYKLGKERLNLSQVLDKGIGMYYTENLIPDADMSNVNFVAVDMGLQHVAHTIHFQVADLEDYRHLALSGDVAEAVVTGEQYGDWIERPQYQAHEATR